jgi:nondiscriminating glutamyl-tRNA synthetase
MDAREISRDNQIAVVNPFGAADVVGVLRERGWDGGAELSAEQAAWCERAAFLLGPQAADRDGLADLLGLVFAYDAVRVMSDVDAHGVMSRYAARDVIRILARLVLDGGACTPERFSEIVTEMKAGVDIRGRELFHPLRLALAGRAGEGGLDRVILLVDAARDVGFEVKTVRERTVEFCSVLE